MDLRGGTLRSENKKTQSTSGQGALEYLLLIGGGVLVATIVLVVIVGGIFPATENSIDDNIDLFTHTIVLNAGGSGGGGGGAVCGNNIQEGSEVCDGTDLDSQTCSTQSFVSGTLACASNCLSFDTSACVGLGPVCGDGIVNGSEQCDGVALNGATCVSEGYASGTLACNGSCVFDTAACVPIADTDAPDAIADLTATTGALGTNTITLQWTVPFEDGTADTGDPSSYQIAFSTSPISSNVFAEFTTIFLTADSVVDTDNDLVSELDGDNLTLAPTPAPQAATTVQSFDVVFPGNFVPGTTYHFAIVAFDLAGNFPVVAGTASAAIPNLPAASFTGFMPGTPVSLTGSAEFPFTWTSGMCAAPSTTDSGIVLSAQTYFPGGRLGDTERQATIEFQGGLISDDDGSTYDFVQASLSALGSISNTTLKDAVIVENDPTFGIVCNEGTSNYVLRSSIVPGTWPVDDDAPTPVSNLAGVTGTSTPAQIDVSWSATADRYLDSVLSAGVTTIAHVAWGGSTVAWSTTPITNVTEFDAAVTAGRFKNGVAGVPGTNYNEVLDFTGEQLSPSTPYYFAVRICDAIDNDTILTPNCAYTYNSATPVTSKRDAFIVEAESGTLGSSLETFSYLSETTVRQKLLGCSAAAGGLVLTVPVTLSAPASPNMNYYVWVRSVNTLSSGNRRYIGVSLAGAAEKITWTDGVASPPPTSFQWRPLPVAGIAPYSVAGGSANLVVEFTDIAGTPTCVSQDHRLDKFLVTTNSSCTPTGNGSNCV